MADDNFMIIGNVRFYANDVAKFERKDRGSMFNSIWLNDGTKVEFFDQPKESNAEVMMGIDLSEPNVSKKGVKFTNIVNAFIYGTEKEDHYYLQDTSGGVCIKDDDPKNSDSVRKIDTRPSALHTYILKNGNDKFVDVNKDNPDLNISKNEGFFYRISDDD